MDPDATAKVPSAEYSQRGEPGDDSARSEAKGEESKGEESKGYDADESFRPSADESFSFRPSAARTTTWRRRVRSALKPRRGPTEFEHLAMLLVTNTVVVAAVTSCWLGAHRFAGTVLAVGAAAFYFAAARAEGQPQVPKQPDTVVEEAVLELVRFSSLGVPSTTRVEAVGVEFRWSLTTRAFLDAGSSAFSLAQKSPRRASRQPKRRRSAPCGTGTSGARNVCSRTASRSSSGGGRARLSRPATATR